MLRNSILHQKPACTFRGRAHYGEDEYRWVVSAAVGGCVAIIIRHVPIRVVGSIFAEHVARKYELGDGDSGDQFLLNIWRRRRDRR
jgi:hypothetical protein